MFSTRIRPCRKHTRTSTDRSQRGGRLFVEMLEARDLLATLFVAIDGNDGGAGSAADPFQSIQQAANVAGSGDTIRVAGGTYTYTPAADLAGENIGTRQVVTILDKRLAIYGGYSRADGFQSANPQANPTVIDGQDRFRGVLVLGSDQPTAIDLQGVTVRRGLATPIPIRGGLSTTFAFGGGVFIDMSDPRARNISGTNLFRNVTFEDNRAVGGNGVATDPALNFGGAGTGGGMALRFATDVQLENVVFRRNVAAGGNGNERGGVGNGGALHADQSKVTGTNVLFADNRAQSGTGLTGTGRDSRFGETADATGGAVSVQTNASAVFTSVTASGNAAVGGNANAPGAIGGAAFGGAFFSERGSITVRDGVVFGNSAVGGQAATGGLAQGGAIHVDRSNVIIDRVKIVSNAANTGSSTGGGAAGAGFGGAISAIRTGNDANALGTVEVTNSVVAANAVNVGTGAASPGGGGGGGLFLQGVTANLTHVTIADNVLAAGLTAGPAIVVLNDGAPTPAVVNLRYSIVSGHGRSAAIATRPGNNTVNFNRNLLFGNAEDTSGAGFTGANTNITGDPMFTSPGAPNFDYSLTAGSAAIDQATGSTTSTDIGLMARTGVPDIGAYEFGTPGTFPVGSTAVGANTPDGAVPGAGGGFNPALTGPAEFAVGAGAGGAPTVNLYQANGTVRQNLTAFDPTFTGGVRVASADFNGDGVDDLVVGTGPGVATLVRVLDGATGAELFSIAPFEASFTGGVYVAAGDITGDGVPELVITPDEGGGPRVRVFNGNGFGQIADFFGIDDPNFRGGARAAIADVNGDGKGDLIVAAGFGGGPRVAVFDGTTIASGTPVKLFNDFFAFEDTLRNGVFVAGGDVNGDGKADLILGGGPGGGPRVRIADGLSLLNGAPFGAPNAPASAELANFFGGDANSRGGIRVAAKDLDGDDRADVLVGAGADSGSRVTAYLGSTITPGATPPEALAFDAFAGFTGGVFVG